MATIFHLALASEWAHAQEVGEYTTSTRGRTLAEEGYIHASRADQWTKVRDRYYADVTEPLVLLHIDTDLLDVPVVEELPAPSASETFPHIYGRLPVSAVVKAIPLDQQRTPATTAPATATRARPTTSEQPDESFTRVYFREMFFNLSLLCVVIAFGVAGAVLGLAVTDAGGTGIGGMLGMAIGGVAAVALYRRRHIRAA
ncbi:DUF952 domain-containing protein [Nocardioides sp. Root190]|uniref:DUF952 domain-containing protein n=1 Tax=Nocardioides sp. Root190 TaxID=1736488 RepID=UPI0009E66D1E|nr:DUF952 domain-containing protein [Nocardioides sp. Root190]